MSLSSSVPVSADRVGGAGSFWSRTLGPQWPVWALALWLTVPGNLPLWQRLLSVTDTSQRVLLLAAMGMFLWTVTAALLQLLAWPKLFRPLASLLVLVAAFNSHFMWQYGVVIDTHMMINVVQTDVREARDLLSWPLLFTVLALAGPPLWWIWRAPWPWPLSSRLGSRGVLLLLTLGVALAALMAGYQPLASAMRLHKDLRFMISPFNTLVATAQVLGKQGAQTAQPLKPVGQDAHLGASYATQTRPLLLMVVVGETARAQNWGLNGYARQTTPSLSGWEARGGLVNFPQTISCGTSTQVSVPCMFSALSRSEGGNEDTNSENLLDVLQRAGLGVYWIDNQAGCKGVCDRVPHARVADVPIPALCEGGECLDEAMMHGLDARVASLDPLRRSRGVVLVMHQMGSHGPAYTKRSPAKRKPFQPECQDVTLSGCEPEQLVNAYDNSIAYTDRFLAHALSWLRAQSTKGQYDTGLIYASDHGESLGENGLYLHGVPYSLAPQQQVHVPMVAWLSPGLQERSGVNPACLRERAAQPVSHDNLFHSVLGLMDVQTRVRKDDLNLFAPCAHQATAVSASPAAPPARADHS